MWVPDPGHPSSDSMLFTITKQLGLLVSPSFQWSPKKTASLTSLAPAVSAGCCLYQLESRATLSFTPYGGFYTEKLAGTSMPAASTNTEPGLPEVMQFFGLNVKWKNFVFDVSTFHPSNLPTLVVRSRQEQVVRTNYLFILT